MAARAQPASGSAPSPDAVPRLRFRKSLKYGMIHQGDTLIEKFSVARAAGFDGVELDAPTEGWSHAEALVAKERTRMAIPSLANPVQWKKPLSHPDPQVRAEGRAALERTIRDAHILGARVVQLVPAIVDAETSYADAYARSQTQIRAVLPLAEELGITIAIENVRNHFLLSPLEAARYIDEFHSDAVRWCFDVGNIVDIGWPAHWIRTLGPRIARLDIKDFSRAKGDANGAEQGLEVELGEGDVDWAAVRAALAEIGYAQELDDAGEAWACADVPGGNAQRLAEIARRMDTVLHAD